MQRNPMNHKLHMTLLSEMNHQQEQSGGTCFVARGAMPCSQTDHITDKLNKLQVSSEECPKKVSSRIVERISPADFVALQSLRSSALARKTNTTSKFGRSGAALFADLLTKGDKSIDEESLKKEPPSGCSDNDESPSTGTTEDTTFSIKNSDDGITVGDESNELLSRGPVRGPRWAPTTHHPYMVNGNSLGIAPQSAVNVYANGGLYSGNNTGYGSCGYDCGTTQWIESPEMIGSYSTSTSSTPDIVRTPQSDTSSSSGYASSMAEPCRRSSPFADQNMTTADLHRLLNVNELPDALSDFILKYSRRYSTSSPANGDNVTLVDTNAPQPPPPPRSPSSRKSSTSTDSSSSSTDSSPKHQQQQQVVPSSVESSGGCDSPMTAGSAPQRSPAAPRGGQSGPSTPSDNRSQTSTLFKSIAPKMMVCTDGGTTRTAKDRLRAMISEADMDEAWAWTCKCTQFCPGALYYRDPDGDSLLHIVVWHKDLAKTYALVEQMLKTEYPPCQKPFDMPNRLYETPLFLAVEKRCQEVVTYLLEAGAFPNIQTRRPEMDAPVHYAAARGMTEIVQSLCSHPATDPNMLNGMGLTPLLCAVKNHGVIEEESQCLCNNKPTIRALLKAGADATIPDATNGKSVIHYAVERMDPELVDIFKANLDEQSMTALVNMCDLNRDTPMDYVQRSSADSSPLHHRIEAEQDLRTKMFVTLVTCGAGGNDDNDYESTFADTGRS